MNETALAHITPLPQSGPSEAAALAVRLETLASAAERERRLYRTILSNTPDLVYVLDLSHQFTYANDALLQLWGKTWDEAIGRTCLELGYEPWHAAMHDRELDEVVATRRPVRGEVPFHGAGVRRVYDYIFAPVLGADGEVEAIAGTTRDVTDMVAAREQVAERGEELEELVRERTLQLAQTARQMEEFSYSVSHDLRSPLRAIRGYAEALLHDSAPGLDGEARDLLGHILRSAQRMDRLIQDLLTFSRISQTEFQSTPVALGPLVAEILQQYPELQPDRADIEVLDPLPEALGHPPAVAQAIANLLTNAVKFVDPGVRPRVTIGGGPGGEGVRLWIRDNGIGIRPEHQGRLFKMFERIDPDRRYEGTGVGLAIVRTAVERMKGRVGVESDGISGSCFWIELPV